MAITIIDSSTFRIDFVDPIRTPEAVLSLADGIITGILSHVRAATRAKMGVSEEVVPSISESPVIAVCDEVQETLGAVNGDDVVRVTVVRDGKVGQIGLLPDGVFLVSSYMNQPGGRFVGHRLLRGDEETRLQEIRGVAFPPQFLEFARAGVVSLSSAVSGKKLGELGLETKDQRVPGEERAGLVRVYSEGDEVDATFSFELDDRDALPPRMPEPVILEGNFKNFPRLMGREPMTTPQALRAQCIISLREILEGVHESRRGLRLE